jgi:hypothetical protein
MKNNDSFGVAPVYLPNLYDTTTFVDPVVQAMMAFRLLQKMMLKEEMASRQHHL